MNDVRALSICYRLLSRMSPNAQNASMRWLMERLEADQVSAKQYEHSITGHDKAEFRHHVGQVALELLSLVKIAGGSSGKRSAEFRGPINADVEIRVRPIR